MSVIFELKDVTVAFNKHLSQERSLRYFLGNLVNQHNDNKHYALKNIVLTINEGERIGFIGQNGAGKSTLLKVLSQVIYPQSGTVYVNPASDCVPLLELGIGFQADLTGRENCYLAGSLLGYTNNDIKQRMARIISFSELENYIDEPVKYYSSGMYARLAFTLATEVEPDVLILDEVFGVGDEFFTKKSIMRMIKLMNQGSTTLMVSHNIDFLVHQCKRLIWIDAGKIQMDGEPEAVATAYRQSGTK
jgi:ABC-type polysaccharide/polyol phosphate transport system ATPase subunit